MKNIIIVLFLLAVPVYGVNAARIFFEPSGGRYEVGDSVNVSVLLDTEGESINAVELGIRVPQLLRVQGVSKSGSAIQLWVQEPSYSNNAVSLIGGIPGGSKGSRVLVGKIITQASAIGEGGLGFLPNSSVLLNDGQGTQLTLTSVSGGVFNVVPRTKAEETPAPVGEEEEEEESATPAPEEEVEITDKKRPQKFDILFGSDPRVFDGQHFISFFSTDKDSGLDHYEVKEGKGDYKIAQSPYLLDDQGLRTVIRVRAYDGAGNYRESVYPNIFVRIWWWITELFGVL
ncbi:MAG TPA: hypothetical protein VJ046_02260 [Candidatus Paceibacterota bacterium]|nr:hypothetical protein [Candidatus Paceibacterota bacterium]